MIKKPVVLPLLAAPQAYVMPDAPEPSSEELAAMTYTQRLNHAYKSLDIFPPEKYALPGSEFDTGEFDQGTASYNEDNAYDYDDEGPIDDRMNALFIKDWQRSVPHDPGVSFGVEIDSRKDATKMLLVAVTLAVNKWRKPPKPEVTAGGIGLAIAYVRKEPEVKHPRDIAKEIGVRPQTLFAVRKVALEEIQRLGLSGELVGAVDEKVGTYNQNEEDETSESSFPE